MNASGMSGIGGSIVVKVGSGWTKLLNWTLKKIGMASQKYQSMWKYTMFER